MQLQIRLRKNFAIKKIKNSVKSAVKFINDFEKTASDIAIENNYDYVVCGHIHQPEIREIQNDKGKTTYLNSGDWVENLTALEYKNKQWKLYEYEKDTSIQKLLNVEVIDPEIVRVESNNALLFKELLAEFNIEQPLK